MGGEVGYIIECLQVDCFRVTAKLGSEPLRFGEAIERWQHDGAFVDEFVRELGGCPFPAYFFETPPLTLYNLGRPFEFVLVDAPSLASMRPDSRSFRTQLDPRRSVAVFHNLGRDALLIAPSDGHEGDCTHLASFSRTAEPQRQRALWRATAEALSTELDEHPRWLSTSGLGVPWLHLRIDTRPKYYCHAPYRELRA